MTASFDVAEAASAEIDADPHRSSEHAGRNCPADYRYPSSIFDRAPEFSAHALYVVGGLYGNLAALEHIERLAEQEGAAVLFNGDFHWFDIEPGWFADIDQGVRRHRAIRGNVETEIGRVHDVGAGCGCDYPRSVSEDLVQRSNEIMLKLRRAARTLPGAAARLAALPMHAVADVGGLRVGIVHGDAVSLAGWAFAHDALDAPGALAMLDEVQRASHIDVFASTHTCFAVLGDFQRRGRRLTVINNGAAGMPNFSGCRFGLLTRIATTPSRQRPLYGIVRGGVHIDAIPVAYDHDAFLRRFLAHWPEGSAAHASYVRRILLGPDYSVEQAAPILTAAAH